MKFHKHIAHTPTAHIGVPARASAPATAPDVAAPSHSFGAVAVTAAPQGAMQPKLAVGAAHDPYEDEGSQVAQRQVMRLTDAQVQRVTPEDDEDTIRAKPGAQRTAEGSFDASAAAEARIAARRGGGSPLPDSTRAFMEPRFRASFAGVRIHADAEADQISQNLSARAFTTGQDIYFRQGEYRPGSSGGQALLAHELTHVLQQGATAIGAAQVKEPSSLVRASLLDIQRKDIKDTNSTIVGEYDGLGALESSYQSTYENEKKSVGVSYFLANARDNNGVQKPNAVAHAHVKGNGKSIEGISVKHNPGNLGAQWVAPNDLHQVTTSELRGEMERAQPSPLEITNMRKVFIVTGNWQNPPHQPGDDPGPSKLTETVYIVGADGFVEERRRLSADLIYDVATGRYRQDNMFASKAEADAAARLISRDESDNIVDTEEFDDEEEFEGAPELEQSDTTNVDTREFEQPGTTNVEPTSTKTRRNRRRKKKSTQSQAVASAPPVSKETMSMRAWIMWAASYIGMLDPRSWLGK